MSMSEIANASINTFGISPKANFESPSEQLITLTYKQLQDLIVQAVQMAVQPLQDEVMQLREEIAQDREEMAALRTRLAAVESLQESEISRVCVDISQDRRRLAVLESVEPQPMQKDRAEILRALIVANNGKMLAIDARHKMRMDKATFSRLLATMKEVLEVRPLHSDKRKMLLIIK